jgi:FAD/FMN-containing dehydrogenase
MQPPASPAPAALPPERVLEPGHPAWDEARSVWNGMISHHPARIVRVETPEEVVSAVAMAREAGLLISIRGGGHNVAGLAVGDGSLMIDMAALHDVRVDPERRRAFVGAGARWGEVDAAAQAHGLVTPGGVVSDTGVAGLTLSGGLGWIRRRHGLSCDALRGVRLVTAGGRIVHASADEHPDLFWALRGGGGNFGVVTEFEFELYPLGPDVATTVAVYPVDEAGARLRELRDLAPSLPDAVAPLAVLTPVPDDAAFPDAVRGRDALFVLAVAAVPVEEGAALLRPLASLGKGPVVDVGGTMPYVEFQRIFDADYPAHTMRYYWKSSFTDSLPDELIDGLVETFGRRRSHHSTIDIWLGGGAISRVTADESAFGQRDFAWLISPEANWEDPADDAANIAWGREVVDLAGGSAYLNFPGMLEAGDQVARASHGSTYARLAEVKRAWDPDNVFRFNANIRPAGS